MPMRNRLGARNGNYQFAEKSENKGRKKRGSGNTCGILLAGKHSAKKITREFSHG